jgi:thiol-disulfide isomerase/thioredoxin
MLMTLRLSVAAVLVPTALLLAMIVGGPLFAQESDASADDAAKSDDSTETETDATPEDQPDVFTVPEGNDAQTLQEFLATLTRTPAAERSPAGFRLHFNKLVDAADLVLQRQLDDETALLAVAIKAGSLDILEQFGDQAAAERKALLVATLQKSDRPALAAQGSVMHLERQVAGGGADAEIRAAVKELLDRMTVLLRERPLTLEHGRTAYAAFSAIEQTEDGKLVSSAAEVFAKPLRDSDDPALNGLADKFEGSARRLNLKGNPLQLTGKTITGDNFNLDEWKGKVVLVDFWATWCGPCVAAMQELKELYETHHDSGFEIVGVSLDDKRQLLEEFLNTQEIPWPTLFDETAGPNGEDHKLATYYDVSTIPTAFLVGRDGKVAAIDLFGEALGEAVVELLEAK